MQDKSHNESAHLLRHCTCCQCRNTINDSLSTTWCRSTVISLSPTATSGSISTCPYCNIILNFFQHFVKFTYSRPPENLGSTATAEPNLNQWVDSKRQTHPELSVCHKQDERDWEIRRYIHLSELYIKPCNCAES